MNRQTFIVLAILVVVAVLVAVGVAATGAAWSRVAISAMGFLAISLLIVSVFSQPGEISMSSQREAAIATGHEDRKTIFENPLCRPLMWLLLLLTHRLAMPGLKRWIRKQLVAAGSPNYYTAEEYLALALLCGFILGVLFEAGSLLINRQFSAFAFFMGATVGAGLAIYQLYDRAHKRISCIARRVPYAMDLISLAMGAGATFTEAVKTVVREQGDDPFNVELRTMLAEMELGSTRPKALANLAQRIPLDSLQGIISIVVQAEELGTPLGDVLHDQATLLRQARYVRAENAAAVASVRILLPCLLLVMAVVLTVFGPMILKAIRGGLF